MVVGLGIHFWHLIRRVFSYIHKLCCEQLFVGMDVIKERGDDTHTCFVQSWLGAFRKPTICSIFLARILLWPYAGPILQFFSVYSAISLQHVTRFGHCLWMPFKPVHLKDWQRQLERGIWPHESSFWRKTDGFIFGATAKKKRSNSLWRIKNMWSIIRLSVVRILGTQEHLFTWCTDFYGHFSHVSLSTSKWKYLLALFLFIRLVWETTCCWHLQKVILVGQQMPHATVLCFHFCCCRWSRPEIMRSSTAAIVWWHFCWINITRQRDVKGLAAYICMCGDWDWHKAGGASMGNESMIRNFDTVFPCSWWCHLKASWRLDDSRLRSSSWANLWQT